MNLQKDTNQQHRGIKSESSGSIHEPDKTGVNPYMTLVTRRMRTLKKRIARIETTEKLLTLDLSAKDKINPDQLSAVGRKVEATAPLKELQGLLDLMTIQDAKDQLAAKKSLEDRAHDVEMKTERVSQEQEEATTFSFIQLIRFFYALKELDDAKDHLEGTLVNSQAVLSVFRAKLFEIAQDAEMNEDKEHQAKLRAMIRKLAEASLDIVAWDGAITFNDVHDEINRITRPIPGYNANGSDGAAGGAVMVINESGPISENATKDIIKNKLDKGPISEKAYTAVKNWQKSNPEGSYSMPAEDRNLMSDAEKLQKTKVDVDVLVCSQAPLLLASPILTQQDARDSKPLTPIHQGIETSSSQLPTLAAPTQLVQEHGYFSPRTESVSDAPLAHPHFIHFRQQTHPLLRPQIQDEKAPLPDQVYCNERGDSVQQPLTKNMQRIQQTAIEIHLSNASDHASSTKSLRRRSNRAHSRSSTKGPGANVVSCQEDIPVRDAGGPPRESNNPFFNSIVAQSGQPELRPSQEQGRRVREPDQRRTRGQGLSPIEEEPPIINHSEHLPPMSPRQGQTTSLISSQPQNQVEQQHEQGETNRAQEQRPEQLAGKDSAASDPQSDARGQQPQTSNQMPNQNQNRRSGRRQGTSIRSQLRSSPCDQVTQMHMGQPPVHAKQPFRQQFPVHPATEPSVPVAFPMIPHPMQHPVHRHHQQLSQLQLQPGQHHARMHVQPYGHQQQYYQYPHYYYPGFHLSYDGQIGGSPVPDGGEATEDVGYDVRDQEEFRMGIPVHERDEYSQYRNVQKNNQMSGVHHP